MIEAGELMVILEETLSSGIPSIKFPYLSRRNRHAAFTKLTQRFGLVRVIAHQSGQVEGNAQACLTLLQQVFEARVRFLRSAEAGKHAHRPQFAAVKRRVDSSCIGVLTRKSERGGVIHVRDIKRRIQSVDRFGGGGDKFIGAFRQLRQRFFQGGLLPFIQ